jgi:hypothetical protein
MACHQGCETLGISRSSIKEKRKMKNSIMILKKVFVLTLVGGLAFWLANFAISRTGIAAEYRAAMSISYNPMLLESLIGGLVIGLWVSYPLVRFFNRIPAKDPVIKSVILSSLVLVVVTITLGGPSSFFATSNVLRYFIISTVFNLIRVTALGIVIGYVYKKQYCASRPTGVAVNPAGLE